MLTALLLAAAEPVPLPGRLEGPLHFPSSSSCVWALVWLLLVAGLLFWLVRRLWQRLSRYLESRRRPAQHAPARPRTASGIGSAIAAILDRHLKARTYRQGCHELSDVLRTHWEARGLARPVGPRFTRMTAREIETRIGESPATRLLSMLSSLQFGRREPRREDLQVACDLATEVVTKRDQR